MKYFNPVLLALYIVIFASSLSFAQEKKDSATNKTTDKVKRVHLKLFYTPSYFFIKEPSQNVSDYLESSPYYSYVDYNYSSKDETGSYGFESGFSLEVVLVKHIYVSLGVAFEQLVSKTKDNTLMHIYTRGDMSLPKEYVVNDSKLTKTYQFFSVPIIVNYLLTEKKLDYSFGAGGSYDMLSQFYTEISKPYGYGPAIFSYNYSPKDPGFPAYRLSFIANISVGYAINNSLTLGIEPHFKYYFTNLYKTTFTHWIGYNSEMNLVSAGATIFLKF